MCKKINLFRSNLRILSASLLLASLFSCKKESSDNLSPENVASIKKSNTSAALLSANILFHENADGTGLFDTYVSTQTATSYGITASTNTFYNGTKSARFELRATDSEVQHGTRAEVVFPDATNPDRWYSFAVYFPASGYQFDSNDEVVSQWHQGGELTPALCLRTKIDSLYLRILGNWITLDSIDKDHWHAYVMHVYHSSASNGLIEMWRDGSKIKNITGPNMYTLSSTIHMPNWKLGVYKSGWNGSSTTGTNLRVLYFDDIKLGNEDATYNEMVPVPVTSVVSFTLVDANTEQDVTTISNGQTISLSGVGLTKLKCNIRANTDPDFAGSVKYELNGPQTDTTIDNNAPYALWGDDGLGNYFFGPWNPPALGTYTLKATPYANDGATGTVGVSKTITFTIVN